MLMEIIRKISGLNLQGNGITSIHMDMQSKMLGIGLKEFAIDLTILAR